MYYTVILSPLISTSTWKCGMITDKNILFLLWSRPRWCLPGDLFRWRDHKWKTSVPHTKVGCWRGCRQKTLGGYLITNHYQNVNCTFSASFFFIWKQRITTAACDILYFYFQSKFLAFYQYAKTFNSDTFDYDELNRTDYVFMRWKEHFLVPDHTIKVCLLCEK